MEFDPDAFIAKKQAELNQNAQPATDSSGFDPDAFIAKRTQQEQLPPAENAVNPEPPQIDEQRVRTGLEATQAGRVFLELAAGANRGVTELLDFLGPNQVNAVLSLSGSDYRVPTVTNALAPATQGNFMDPGLARDVTRAAGEVLIPGAAATIPVQGRNVASVTGAAAELIGAGTASVAQPIAQVVTNAAQPIAQATTKAVDTIQQALPNKARDAAKLPLLRQTGDVAAAGFKLDDAGKVIPDKIQKNAIGAGIDEGVVATIASANKSTKNRIREMIEVIEGGKNNLVSRSFERPANIVGDALNDRFKIITNANKEAARRLDGAADALKGKPIDVSLPINKFLDDLSKEGISVDLNSGALNFDDSSIEGLTAAQEIIRNTFKRLYMSGNPTVNAYRVHTAKRFIDEQVSYGRSQGGLSGRMEGIVKSLRHNLDQVLDKNFPEYDRVNTVYKETRDVIDEAQSLVGQKINLLSDTASQSLGKLSRKVLSNYASGERVDGLLDSLDEVASKYSTPLTGAPDDELRKLIAIEAELRKMFKTAAPANSFQGEIGAEITRGAADLASGNAIGLLGRVEKAYKSLFSKGDQAKINALKELLAEK